VLLSEITYGLSADPNSPIAAAVKAANNDSIIISFPVAAFNKEGDPVIEVGRLFTSDVQEFSARQRIGATGVDASRTFIERIAPFQDNIETEGDHDLYQRWRTRRGSRWRARRRARRWKPCGATAPPLCCTTAWSSYPKSL